jgi:transposase
MSAEPIDLPADLDTAHGMIRELLATLRRQEVLVGHLQHQLERLLRQRYGRSAERIDPDQLLLFARELLERTGPAEAAGAAPQAPPPEPRTPATKGHGRKPLPAGLPRRRVVHDVPPEARACPECGTERRSIGEDVREQLEYVPASLVVLQHVRPKYACRACAAHVVIAERLPEAIEKGLPGPGLLAHVAVSKYADSLPLYRQEAIFRRHGVELSRKTMCDWMATCARLLEPIRRALAAAVLRSRVVGADDTPVRVLDPGGEGTRTGRLWAYVGDVDHPYTVFDYTVDRSCTGPARFLKDYRGYLQADAFSGYEALYRGGVITEVGCWAHARRKFHDARTSDPERSHQALARIRLLYEVERAAKDFDAEARLALRRERSGPILEEFRSWLEEQLGRVLPKAPMGQAIGYALSNWAALSRYAATGFVAIDNNRTENALRPVAVGRKNWLFAGSDGGGETAAVLLSLTTSCRAVGVEPFGYLRDLLERVSTHPAKRIAELLPDRWQALRAEGTGPAGT